ncbi:hypothetical protein TNCV_3349031 [Trichonephila clavipes]|nr:hypothetical protein TNCV_3349031 [Trichonephila clavipes]
MIVLSDELNGGGFQAIIGDEYLMMRDTPFNHYGCFLPLGRCGQFCRCYSRNMKLWHGWRWQISWRLTISGFQSAIKLLNSSTLDLIPLAFRRLPSGGPVSMAGIKCLFRYRAFGGWLAERLAELCSGIVGSYSDELFWRSKVSLTAEI